MAAISRRPALRDHVAAGILEISAGVLAERGEAASMADIAAAAGVARATLYRYFPNRDVLVRALTETALTDLAGRIADAKLDEVPVEVAIARMTRAVVATISKYQGLALFQKALEDPHPQARRRPSGGSSSHCAGSSNAARARAPSAATSPHRHCSRCTSAWSRASRPCRRAGNSASNRPAPRSPRSS
ncbi:TetR family transcriptional regulator [Thermocatellispora tengchongensis]|uniref:TetR family transcriptional regulator n=1 Tax=Thermocatellispora tengchongensis TaxID=1073253 RepID=UPI00363BA509